MSGQLEFAIDTFGDVTVGASGKLLSQAQVIRNVVAEGVLADQVGLDFFRGWRTSPRRFCGDRAGDGAGGHCCENQIYKARVGGDCAQLG